MTLQAMTTLERTPLAAAGANMLKRAIVSGLYAPGSALPPEKDLARQLGVTRLTVREAVAMLEATGFATRRHGSGTYVTDFSARATLAVLMDMLGAGRPLRPEEARSLMAFRQVVIGGFAPAIAQGVTPQDVTQLRAVLAQARATTRVETLAELDYRWNELLAQASGNVFYLLLMRSVRPVHLQLGVVIFRQAGRDIILATQEAIVEALATGATGKFLKILNTYLEGGANLVDAWSRAGNQTRATTAPLAVVQPRDLVSAPPVSGVTKPTARRRTSRRKPGGRP